MKTPIKLPPKRLWLSQRGAKNQTGECDSDAIRIERIIALDTAKILAKWIKK